MKEAPIRTVEMRAMLLDGHSYREVGKTFHVSRQRVQQLLSPPKHIVAQLVARSGGRCESCGLILPSGGHVHHVNGDSIDPARFDGVDNLMFLCPGCHRRAHGCVHESVASVTPRLLRCGTGKKYTVVLNLTPSDRGRVTLMARESGKTIGRYLSDLVIAALESYEEVNQEEK